MTKSSSVDDVFLPVEGAQIVAGHAQFLGNPEANLRATAEALRRGATLHTNLKTDVLQISEDRVKNILNEYQLGLEKYIESRRAWAIPLSMGATSLLAACTADFSKAPLLSAGEWRGGFIFAAIACAVWLSYAMFRWYRTKRCKTVDQVVAEFRASAEKEPPPPLPFQ